MREVRILLTEPQDAALRDLAKRQCRETDDQARFMVLSGLDMTDAEKVLPDAAVKQGVSPSGELLDEIEYLLTAFGIQNRYNTTHQTRHILISFRRFSPAAGEFIVMDNPNCDIADALGIYAFIFKSGKQLVELLEKIK